MKRRLFAGTALAIGLFAATPATAAVTYNVSHSGSTLFQFTTDGYLTGTGTIATAQFDSCSFPNQQISQCSVSWNDNGSGSDGFLWSFFNGGPGLSQVRINFVNGAFVTPGTYLSSSTEETLVVSGTPAVPEPETWSMMLLGFGGVGLAFRRKKNAGILHLA